jgi:predicted nucleic acid-binding protein
MSRAVLIDTNLLILLAVGYCDKKQIGKAPRVKEFEPDHFDVLDDYVRGFDRVILCPNILTETSNLLSKFKGELGLQLRDWIKNLAAMHQEHYVTSKEATNDQSYAKLGLTDAVLLALSKSDVTLITADLDLYLAAIARKQPAVNFNHLTRV